MDQLVSLSPDQVDALCQYLKKERTTSKFSRSHEKPSKNITCLLDVTEFAAFDSHGIERGMICNFIYDSMKTDDDTQLLLKTLYLELKKNQREHIYFDLTAFNV